MHYLKSQNITKHFAECTVGLWGMCIVKMINTYSPGPGYTPRAPPPTTRTHMIFLTLPPLLHMESEFNSDESGSRRSFWPYFYQKRHFLKKK